MVPSTLAMELALFPAILMALAVVREKELGSITNLYVTPVTRLEFLLGKQLPYIAVAMVNFALMFLMALFVFEVPLKGSFLALLLGDVDLRQRDDSLRHADLGLRPHPDRGAVRHRHSDRSAGDDVCRDAWFRCPRCSGMAQIMGRLFPMTYFLPVSVGTFTKGLGFSDLRHEPGRARGLRPGADIAEPSAAAQAGALGGRRAMQNIANIFWLGTKELRSFLRDFVLLGLVIYAFSLAIIAQAQSSSQEVHNASVAIVDEDHSELSRRIAHAFLPPYFQIAAADRRAGHRPVDEQRYDTPS